MTLFSNHHNGWRVAKLLTEVGDWRVSIGPLIIVIERGTASPRAASNEIAANTGTVGWHTLITCRLSVPIWRINSLSLIHI